MFMGTESCLRSSLSGLLIPCCSTPLSKITYRSIIVALFPDTPSHFVLFWRRPGNTPLFTDHSFPMHEARNIWLQGGKLRKYLGLGEHLGR